MAEVLSAADNTVRSRSIRFGLMGVMIALPWIDRTNISTLLLCGLGLYAAFAALQQGKRMRTSLHLQPLFGLSLLYFAAYAACWAVFPQDPSVRYAVQQKSAFALVPLVLYQLLSEDRRLWRHARIAFAAGTAFALLCCLAAAYGTYRSTGKTAAFFYHDLVKLLSANAIYTSLYTLISIAYLSEYLPHIPARAPWRRAGISLLIVFLVTCLLLLSSKLLIIAGAGMLLIYIYRHARPGLQRISFVLLLAAMLAGVFTTSNPIRERFSVVAWEQPEMALKYTDYSAATLDGLSLRLLLWRMGVELLAERDAWLGGLGGKHYHQLLNEKIAAYKLYEGYQDIDLHNQYMEFFVGFGLSGLLLWLCLLGYAAFGAIRQRNAVLGVLLLIFAIAFLTESVLETQAGILIFTIIISGEWIQRQLS